MKHHRRLALWAADCAQRALPNFSAAHPDDGRPQAAINAARGWAAGDLATTEARKLAFAAHAAAREAATPEAIAAARAAGHAAATAHVATHARHAAGYALKSAEAAGRDIAAEQAWQSAQMPLECPVQEGMTRIGTDMI
ncbi:putative immunity protein [Sphingopyxis panaciterrae]